MYACQYLHMAKRSKKTLQDSDNEMFILFLIIQSVTQWRDLINVRTSLFQIIHFRYTGRNYFIWVYFLVENHTASLCSKLGYASWLNWSHHAYDTLNSIFNWIYQMVYSLQSKTACWFWSPTHIILKYHLKCNS